MEFRSEEMMMFAGLDMCVGWIAALLLIVIGFVSVRAANKKAGLAVGGAGVLLLLTGCCGYWGDFYVNTIGYDPLFETVWPLSIAMAALFKLGGYGVVLFGAATAAGTSKSERGTP